MDLKTIVSGLARLGKLEKLDGFLRLGKLLVLLLVLIILVGWLPEITPGFIADYFKQGKGGIVIVDSPEVYSRERLINDRFRQVAWLEDELDKSPDLAFGNQAISDLQQVMRLNSSIGHRSGSETPEDVSQDATAGGEKSSSAAEANASVSPSERFRDIRAYREEIRTEMMETLLDDRHDIKGNTLYRLKFDTTVLPEENTEKLVVIQVKLDKAPECPAPSGRNSQDSSDPTGQDSEPHPPCISIDAIRRDWLQQTEEKMNKVVRNTIKSITSMSLTTERLAEFVRYLQEESVSILPGREDGSRRIEAAQEDLRSLLDNQEQPYPSARTVQKIADAKARLRRLQAMMEKLREEEEKTFNTRFDPWLENVEAWEEMRAYDDACIDKANLVITRNSAPSTSNESDTDKRNREAKLRAELRNELQHPRCRPTPAYRFFNASDEPEINARYQKLRKLLFRYYADNLDDTDALKTFKRAHTCLPSNQEMPNDACGAESSQTRSQWTPGVDKNQLKILREAEIAELALLRYAVVNYWIDKYTYKQDVRTEKCRDFYQNKLEVFDDKSMSCLAHLEKTACGDIDFCTIKVDSRIPELRRKNMCENEAGDQSDDCGLLDQKFKELLRIEESFFSYAVTPKESAQRILSLASERRQKQLALSLIAASPDGIDAAALNGLTQAISDSSTQIEQIQRKPLVLSFGRGQPVPVNGVDEAESARGIDFGWILGPKYVFSDGNKSEIRFVHAPVQNSLSAVISVPSWWTAVDLKINTCWIDPNEILALEQLAGVKNNGGRNSYYAEDFCGTGIFNSSHKNDVNYLIRLPGSAEELPRKFGYEIERVPATDSQGFLADFYIGQENASLIIEGDELWRSTVVTLGHQKANEIEVLPNMKGIIATFDVIKTPGRKIVPDPKRGRDALGPPISCVVSSEVIVWTSEGKTQQRLYARIHPNPKLQDGESPPPRGFGDCEVAQQGQ